MTRRTILSTLATAPFLGGQTQPPATPADIPPPKSIVKNYGGNNDAQRIAPMLCVLSSNMAKVPWEELGNVAQQMGFDGVDLTCYHGGHVEPDLISVDLVRAFEVVRGAGINVPVVTTHITNLGEPNAFGIIALSGNSDVPVYRTGLWKYGMNPNIGLRLQEIRRDLMQMIMGGRKYNIAAAIPNHLGGNFGAAIVDTQMMINDLDPLGVGYFYDVAQAFAVGPNEEWTNTLRIALPRLKAVSISDFTWAGGRSVMQPCPLGEGIVDFRKLFGVLAQARFVGPISIAMDYKAPAEVPAIHKDLEYARKLLGEAYGLGAKS